MVVDQVMHTLTAAEHGLAQPGQVEGRGPAPGGVRRYLPGGHETFPFRAGWLKKGFDAARSDRYVFQRPDAVVRLGVGKNMVQAIRFWCLACRLLEEEPTGRRERPVRPTVLAERWLDGNGWDPYLEDPASLWLLHWCLATHQARPTLWYHLWSRFPLVEFDVGQVQQYVARLAERGGQRLAPATLRRDIECFLRTYLPAAGRAPANPWEGSWDCPLVELGLLRRIEAGQRFAFRIGPKPGLPLHVVAFALLEMVDRQLATRSVSLAECLHGEGSPGRVFCLDRQSLLELLEGAAGEFGLWEVRATAAGVQVFLATDLVSGEARLQILDSYFGGSSGDRRW